ncbi:MAG: C39 family peptidase [Rhodococcus sp. (in: high G+C Gram-positive bacteria)]
MHEFDDGALFSFAVADDIAETITSDPYGDNTAQYTNAQYDDTDPYEDAAHDDASRHGDDAVPIDQESAWAGPHPADRPGSRDGVDNAAAQLDSLPPRSQHPLLTGNPALDIDLSNIDCAGADPDAAPNPHHHDSDTDTGADPEPEATAAPDTGEDSGVHGNPVQWTIDWFYQQVDGYCGPSVVGQLVAEYTGANITDPQHLVDRAVELGLISAEDPAAGMTLPDIERLLEDQGVPATISSGSLDDLRARLGDGHAVIAMVDSGEIWQPSREGVEDNTPDHVLVVAGIDDDRGVVILSDPGVPNGSQLEVPIEQFEQAWADSGNQMLVADHPDPDLIPAAPTLPPEIPSTAETASNSAAAAPAPTRSTVISLRP